MFQGRGHGQETTFPSIPRAEYYGGLILLQEGDLDEAQELFVLGLGRAIAPGEPRGIESIPFLAALGECDYQRGNLAAALDWHESVLQLVNQTQGWTQWVEPAAIQGLKTNPDDRGLSFSRAYCVGSLGRGCWMAMGASNRRKRKQKIFNC